MKTLFRVWMGALAILAAIATQAQQLPPAAFARKVALNISSQPVADALRELGEQTGLAIIIESQLGGDIIAPRLVGTYTAAEALRRLLPKSLHAEYLDQRTVAVLSSQTQRKIVKTVSDASPPRAPE